MEEEKIKLAFIVVQKMIEDTEEKYQKAVQNENWSYAFELESYQSGLNQAFIVFEKAIGQ